MGKYTQTAQLFWRVPKAKTWDELWSILADAQQLFVEGLLPGKQVDELSRRCQDRARELSPSAQEKQPDKPLPLQKQRLSDLFRGAPLHRVYSRVLGEEVLWARDDAEIPKGNTLVVYRQSELPRMVGKTPDQVRAIHLAKKALDGELMTGDAGGEPPCPS
jgi:hypothetical protein